MKQLQRLLFLQGGRCFFCKEVLHSGNASVEHLQAVTNGGANSDSNCVACCKAVNAALGSLSIKEKIQVFLNQRGDFVCPAKQNTGEPIARAPERMVVGQVETIGVTAQFPALPKLTAAKPKPTEIVVEKPAPKPVPKAVPKPVPKAVPKAVPKPIKATSSKTPTSKAIAAVSEPEAADMELVLAKLAETLHLPTTESSLKNWIGQQKRGMSQKARTDIVEELKRRGYVRITARKVSYHRVEPPNLDVAELGKLGDDFLF